MKGVGICLGHLAGREIAARTVDGHLDDLLVAPPSGHLIPGTIVVGLPRRQMKHQGGVMVELPQNRMGFAKDVKGVIPGRPRLFQVSGFASENKAVPITSRLLIKTRTAILTPNAPGINISRQISDDATRDRLKALFKNGKISEDTGLIIRSVAGAASDDELLADLAHTLSIAAKLESEVGKQPAVVYDGDSPHAFARREWDDGDALISNTLDDDLQEQITALANPYVALRPDGSIIVEPTRALVAVDVNSGSDTSPAAALKANVAAAKALPRALRLRGLGGQITVDFARVPKKDRRTIESVLKSALRHDPIETALAGWTPLGNCELQRKRERLPLKEFLDGLPDL